VNPGDKVAVNVSSQINDGDLVAAKESGPAAAPAATAAGRSP
jgi:hypothetical protein